MQNYGHISKETEYAILLNLIFYTFFNISFIKIEIVLLS
jgi:hypothetical protein